MSDVKEYIFINAFSFIRFSCLRDIDNPNESILRPVSERRLVWRHDAPHGRLHDDEEHRGDESGHTNIRVR